MEQEKSKIIDLLKVSFDEDSGTYKVEVPNGSNVNETAFCVMVLVKCLIRDGFVNTKQDFYDMVNKYYDDSQFEEVKKEEENGEK